jgi:TonB-dependent receptor
MTRIETKSARKTIQMTALAFAAAQVALLCGNAYAQTEASASEQGAKDGATNTVVVTGQRKQLETASAIKRNSDLIVDSVVADEAGKLPDKSITEVLQRVVGVTMDRNRSRQGANLAANGLEFNVEGSGIQVRGLSWGSSTLNGRESFSAGWPGRELSWGDVPPELMAGVDVYKNPSAELIEGGISGQVDLRTRLPFDAKGQYGALSASSNYAELGKTKSPAFSGLYSNRWKTSLGEFGALVDLSLNKTRNRFDTLNQSVYYPRNDVVAGQTVWAPVGADWGTTTGKNQRTGIYAALQWKNQTMESALTYFDSAFHETTYNSEIGISAGSNYGDSENPYKITYTNAKFDNNGIFQSGVLSHPIGGQGANQFLAGGIGTNVTQNYRDVHGRTRELAWNFKWRVSESWTFQNDLQWVHATNSGDYGMINLGTFAPSIGIDESGSRPSYFFDDKARAFLADPRNYYWGISQPEVNRAKADLYAWKVDGKYTFDHPVLRDFRFGVRLTERSSRKDKNAGTGWKSYSEGWGVRPTDVAGQLPKVSDLGWQRSNFGYMSDPKYAALGNVETYAFPNFFNGRMAAPPTVVIPTLAMVQDKPAAYRNLLTALKYNCLADNAIKNGTNDCSTAGSDWKPDGFSSDPQYVSKHNEGTQAVHGTLRFGFDDWKYPVDGNVGVRVVRTKTVAHGYVVFKPQYSVNTDPSVPRFGEINEPLDLKASHVDVIPSLNLKASLTDKLQARLAMSRGISRPGFDQMQEYITLSQNVKSDPNDSKKIATITYTGKNDGNVNLKPLKSNNFDLSLEWYPHPGQSLTAAVFYKQVKDIILSETYSRTYKDLAGNDMEFTITGPSNAAKARVRGVELAGMTYLDHIPGVSDSLPEWAKGFGVSSNFTYIDGKQQLYHPFKSNYCPAGELTGSAMLFGCDTNGLPFKDMPVPYMSKRAFNLAFMYDRGPVSARLAYSWRDRTLLATGVYGASGSNGTSADPARKDANGVEPKDVGWGLPVWQEPVGQWDAGISYRFTDHFSGSFNASNLTRTVTKQTNQQAPGNMGRSWFDPGRSFRVQATYVF